MNIITLDIESYFADDYTLSKMTTEAYVRDERFQALGLGLRMPNGQTFYYDGPEAIAEALRAIDWETTAVLCHHAHFDGLILSHHYQIRPRKWLDTLSMGRHLFGNRIGLSLGDLAAHFQLLPKSIPYDRFRGLRWEQIPVELRNEMAEGCAHDCDLTFQIFEELLSFGFPDEEFGVIDMTIRMFTEPVLVGDTKHFEWIKEKEWLTKNSLLFELGVTAKELRSPIRFAEMLKAEGVDVEMKQGTNGAIPAFARSDDQMHELLNDPNDRVVDLVQARLEVSSSIDETRAARFEGMSRRGALPLYLSYCGADTLRWSGGDKANPQNLGRNSELRRGICAPEGHLLGVYDQKQIECRILSYLAGQTDDLASFANGEDPYCTMASRIYGQEVTPADPPRRGVGKQAILMCGYGAWAYRFQQTAKHGAYGPPVMLTDEQALAAVTAYRSSHQPVLELWEEADELLYDLCKGYQATWRGLLEIRDKKIVLPNGARMSYVLRWDPDYEREGRRPGSWLRYRRKGQWVPTFGAKIVQNVCEALARLHLSQRMLELQNDHGMRSVCTVHDEAWVVHPAAAAEERHQTCIEVMSKPPAWAPDLPVAVEGFLGERYVK